MRVWMMGLGALALALSLLYSSATAAGESSGAVAPKIEKRYKYSAGGARARFNDKFNATCRKDIDV